MSRLSFIMNLRPETKREALSFLRAAAEGTIIVAAIMLIGTGLAALYIFAVGGK